MSPRLCFCRTFWDDWEKVLYLDFARCSGSSSADAEISVFPRLAAEVGKKKGGPDKARPGTQTQRKSRDLPEGIRSGSPLARQGPESILNDALPQADATVKGLHVTSHDKPCAFASAGTRCERATLACPARSTDATSSARAGGDSTWSACFKQVGRVPHPIVISLT